MQETTIKCMDNKKDSAWHCIISSSDKILYLWHSCDNHFADTHHIRAGMHTSPKWLSINCCDICLVLSKKQQVSNAHAPLCHWLQGPSPTWCAFWLRCCHCTELQKHWRTQEREQAPQLLHWELHSPSILHFEAIIAKNMWLTPFLVK